MAGKVAEIATLLTKENLAAQISQLYDRWKMQRKPIEAEWLELRNYLFATDTSTTSNADLPWKNKTTIPKLTQIRDNLHANYQDALFPNDNWFRWVGDSEDDVVLSKRTVIENYIHNKIRESGFRETISQCVQDYIDFGIALADVVWVNDTYEDPVTKETVSVYTGPKAVRVSPLDIIFNPTATDFKYSPKITRYVKTVGELKKDVEMFPEYRYDETALNKALDIRRVLSGMRSEDIDRVTAYQADGFGSLSAYYQSGYVEILEFEGDLHDQITGELLERRIITILDRSIVLRNVENPSWFGRDTKEMVSWRDRPDNLYGMGPLANLVGLQYRVDHLENLKADAMDLTVQPPLVIQGDVDPFTYEPFSQIHVPEDGNVTSLAPNQAVLAVNNEIAYLLNLMEEMAGAPKEAMGIRSPGEKTAFEVQQLQNAAGRIFQHKTLKFEAFVEKLLNTMLEVARRNMDQADLIKVIDDDIGVATFMSVTRKDITGKGKLRPSGAKHYAARAQLMQNMNGVFNSPVGNIISPHVSPKRLSMVVKDLMDFGRYDFIMENAGIMEQMELQQFAQQLQSQAEVQEQIPAEEGILGLE